MEYFEYIAGARYVKNGVLTHITGTEFTHNIHNPHWFKAPDRTDPEYWYTRFSTAIILVSFYR
jgi:hypothetical protein